MKFEGKLALITGASSGIGEAFARELHLRGAKLILVARREDRLQALVKELNSARYIVADLATAEGVAKISKIAETEVVDILVNNAGIGSFGYFESLPIERELEMIALNITATTRLAYAFAGPMKQRKSGAIITISSIAGIQPIPYMATYSATKSYNFAHSMALRQELAPFGVRVLTVCPGPIATEFGGVARVPGTPSGTGRDSAETVAQESLSALIKNRAWIITGPRGRWISLPSRFLPVSLTTWVTKRLLDPVIRSILSRI